MIESHLLEGATASPSLRRRRSASSIQAQTWRMSSWTNWKEKRRPGTIPKNDKKNTLKAQSPVPWGSPIFFFFRSLGYVQKHIICAYFWELKNKILSLQNQDIGGFFKYMKFQIYQIFHENKTWSVFVINKKLKLKHENIKNMY